MIIPPKNIIIAPPPPPIDTTDTLPGGGGTRFKKVNPWTARTALCRVKRSISQNVKNSMEERQFGITAIPGGHCADQFTGFLRIEIEMN